MTDDQCLMTNRYLIGLSSGTSLDGVDAALVDVQGTGLNLRLKLVHFVHQDYPRDLRDLIAKTSSSGVTSRQAGIVHRFLGEAFATTVRLVADQARVGLTKIQSIGCAGHTVWHDTEART